MTKFKYHRAGSVGNAAYDPAGIFETLRKQAASTLQSLEVEADENRLWLTDATQFVGSLRMSPSLRSVRTESLAFELPSSEHGNMTQT